MINVATLLNEIFPFIYFFVHVLKRGDCNDLTNGVCILPLPLCKCAKLAAGGLINEGPVSGMLRHTQTYMEQRDSQVVRFVRL